MSSKSSTIILSYTISKLVHFLRHSVVINFIQPPEPNQNMPYLSTYRQPAQNSTKTQKFRNNGQIPQLGSKFRIPWKTAVPRNNTVHWGQNQPQWTVNTAFKTQSFQRVFLRFVEDDCAAELCLAVVVGTSSPCRGIASMVADVVQLAESLGAWVAAETKFILNCVYKSSSSSSSSSSATSSSS